MTRQALTLFDPSLMKPAVADAFKKLDPRVQWRNPVMFVVYIGSAFTTALAAAKPGVFTIGVAVWLWFTVLFANFAEAVAEGRGKAQADTLRATRSETDARRLAADGSIEVISSADLDLDDRVEVEAGEVIPSDGEVVEGIATVDESAITGESAPVIRESGGDRSAVTGGTRVLSDEIVVRITARAGERTRPLSRTARQPQPILFVISRINPTMGNFLKEPPTPLGVKRVTSIEQSGRSVQPSS